MIKYICKKCNNLICETSICPECGERTAIESSKIYWCNECNIPLFECKCDICGNDAQYIGTDIRPVFPRERLLMEILQGKDFEYVNKSIWCTAGSNYIVDGKKIKLSLKKLMENNPLEKVRREIVEKEKDNIKYEEDFINQEYIKKFILANKLRLNYITDEAIQYIKESAHKYNFDEIFVSFSGGKDSTVTSDLVLRAFGREDIIHIYGDTTLEYPETGVYLKKFREVHPKTPMLIAKNKEQSFDDLCEVIGPPSRMMRWCCTIFKTGAITRKIESTFKDKKNILTFMGVRRNESVARSKYDRDSSDSKISKQKVASPIIDWIDFDVWLYLLANKVEFNNAYKLGFARVGCWCCPNNSSWSEYLSGVYMPEMYDNFHNILLNFARGIGKPDPEDYVSQGGWKARQGGNGLEYSKNAIVDIKPCALIENTFNFELNKEIDDNLYELFKPFGIINKTIGNKRLNEVYVLDRLSNEPLLKIVGRIGQKSLKVTVVNFKGAFKDGKIAESLIKSQITKYQICIGCLACEAHCKHNAIKISNIGKDKKIDYLIDETKCKGCLECVKHFSGGCFMKKVLRTKIGEK